MKNKIFRYKLVYWISISISIFTVSIFSFSVVNRISFKAFSDFRDILFSVTTILIAISAVVSLVFLLIKNKNAVKAFSVMLICLLSTFTLGILDSLTVKKDFDDDVLTVSLIIFMYLMTFGFLWMANKFKNEDNSRLLEIDEIGVKE